MILVIFPIAGNNGKYINIYSNEKKYQCRNRFGLLPKQYCEKHNLVLQYNHCIAEILGWKEAGLKENCIAIQLGVLQEVADLVKGIVLQHSGLRWAVSKVYCNTGRLGLECIAIQLANLYCEEAWPVSRYNRLGRRWAGSWVRRARAERAGERAWGARAGAAGS